MRTSKCCLNDEISLEKRFYSSPEGSIFINGLCLLLVYCLGLYGTYLLNPEQGLSKALFSITRLFIGNPAGVFLGYAMGFSQAFVVVANMGIDTIIILILYPLLVLAFKEIFNISILEPFKTRILKTAHSHHKLINKYGLLGLFLFVLFPLWGTGPVVGSVIGFLMGLRPGVNLSIVLSASYLITNICSVFLKYLYEFVVSIDPNGPMLLVLALLMIIIAIKVFRWLKNKKRSVRRCG